MSIELSVIERHAIEYFDKMIEEGVFEASVKVIQECHTLSYIVEKGIRRGDV